MSLSPSLHLVALLGVYRTLGTWHVADGGQSLDPGIGRVYQFPIQPELSTSYFMLWIRSFCPVFLETWVMLRLCEHAVDPRELAINVCSPNPWPKNKKDERWQKRLLLFAWVQQMMSPLLDISVLLWSLVSCMGLAHINKDSVPLFRSPARMLNSSKMCRILLAPVCGCAIV